MSKSLRFPRVNNVIISGRLTRDIDLRYTSSGTPVAKLSIAVDRRIQRDGKWENEASYFDVVVWDQKASSCAEYLAKGSAVLVEGRLQSRSYTNNEGRNVKITEIQANRIHFLEWNEGAASGYNEDDKFEESTGGRSAAPPMSKEEIDSGSSTEDDVPF